MGVGGGSAGVSEAERKKFSSVLLQKPEQFVKLMFAECLEICSRLTPFLCITHKYGLFGPRMPPTPPHVYLSRTLTAHLN